jgi:S-formylglutathione hydrolase
VITKRTHKAFGGVQGFYEHESQCAGGAMRFGVFIPPGEGPFPAVYFLAGLECTEETFALKSGAQAAAAELGLALVTPDTSPRAVRIPGDDAAWDFGQGAGFYVDATEAPWSSAYRMHRYVTDELRREVEASFPVRHDRRGVFGHSMGGHGALVLGLRNPALYQSVSALAPIAAPSEVPWGEKAFTHLLGPDRQAWRGWDASLLLADGKRVNGEILVDQGTADRFLDTQLRPERLSEAAAAAGQPLTLRRQDGYDHGYFFIASFVADHLRHHAARLRADG